MEHHHILCLLLVRGLETISLVGGKGVEKKGTAAMNALSYCM
jgi:hypothetical protein